MFTLQEVPLEWSRLASLLEVSHMYGLTGHRGWTVLAAPRGLLWVVVVALQKWAGFLPMLYHLQKNGGPGMPVRAFSQPRFPICSWDSWLLKAMDIWRASGIHRSKVSKEYWQYRIRKYFLSVSLKKALWHCWTAFVAIAEVNIALKGVSAVNALGLCLSWGTNDSGIETTFTARM